VNSARLLGPSIAGVIIAAVGEGWCFMLDGVSYLAVIASLLLMTLPQAVAEQIEEEKLLRQFREGWNYIVRFKPIRNILFLLALLSLIGMPYTVLMPIFADEILGGGPYVFGWLMAASGVGALMGALFLAARKTVLGLGKFVPVMAGVFGAGLIAFSFSRELWLSLLLRVVTGLGFMAHMAVSNTLLQTIVEEDKRGRVMSFYTVAVMGTMPFGSLLAGAMGARIGAPHTLLISGICCIVGALWFAKTLPSLRRDVRPIYVKRGILPKSRRAS
jgi:MFS family permease